jgi:hypothetical protein
MINLRLIDGPARPMTRRSEQPGGAGTVPVEAARAALALLAGTSVGMSVCNWTPQERRALLNCRLHLGIVNHRHGGRHRERPVDPARGAVVGPLSSAFAPNKVDRQAVIDLL